MPLNESDDFIHAIGDDPNWREAYYFDFCDPHAGITGFGYAGVHPNQETGDVIFALWRDGVLLDRYTRWDFNIPRDIGEERLGFGPLVFVPREPFRRWEVFFDDGYCQLDLAFESIHAPYSWADSEPALAATDSHHYEQQGRYRGTVRVRGTEHPIEAVGVRDHAWGWGARAGIRRWIWASAQFGTDFAFNTFQVGLGDGRDVLYGYVMRGGENRFLGASRLHASFAVRGQAPAALDLALAGRDGEQLQATATVINAFNISHEERNKQGFHYFCATEYQCEGRRGYGHSNFYWRRNALRPARWTVGGGGTPE